MRGATVSLDDLMADYRGPRVHLDFDGSNQLIGVEILAPSGAGIQ